MQSVVFASQAEKTFFQAALEAGLQFECQKEFPYIAADNTQRNKTVDFYWENESKQIKIAVECDGVQHHKTRKQDSMRDDDLRDRGVVVFRFSAQRILEKADACVQRVQDYIVIQEEILSLRAKARKIVYADD